MPRRVLIGKARGLGLAGMLALASAGTVPLTSAGCTASDEASNETPTATGDGGAHFDANGLASDAAGDGSSSDGATEVGDGADGPVASSPACLTYCSTIQGACAGDYPQFGTMNACLRACAVYPPGDPADQSGSGNTLVCRQQHATSSVSGTYHCFHGGPYGYGGCGSMCEGFCQIAMSWCAGSAGGAPFASAAACGMECEAWTWAPSGTDGLAAYRANVPAAGNTLECREYQLVKALESNADRDTYCPRAGSNSVACQ